MGKRIQNVDLIVLRRYLPCFLAPAREASRMDEGTNVITGRYDVGALHSSFTLPSIMSLVFSIILRRYGDSGSGHNIGTALRSLCRKP